MKGFGRTCHCGRVTVFIRYLEMAFFTVLMYFLLEKKKNIRLLEILEIISLDKNMDTFLNAG